MVGQNGNDYRIINIGKKIINNFNLIIKRNRLTNTIINACLGFYRNVALGPTLDMLLEFNAKKMQHCLLLHLKP